MTDADVTPNGNWDQAKDAMVQVIGSVMVNKVPIIVVPWTPAQITIKKKDFPNGVVILNEIDRPNDQDPIRTAVKPELNLRKSNNESEDVPIIFNSGWPSGEIVLWEP